MTLINDFSQIKEDDKFIIYKATGGFVHMFSGFMYTVEKCLKMNRILIIDFIIHGGFKRNFSDYFEITNKNLKYSENYHIIPEKYISKEELNIIKNSPARFNGKNGYTLNGKDISVIDEKSKENIIIYGCFNYKYYPSKKVIKVNDKILDKLKKTIMPSKKFIALHFRNTDKKNNINDFILKLKDKIKETNINIVYLATDDYATYNIIKNNLDKKIELLQYCPPINLNGKNIHLNDPDKDKMIYNTLLDMYVILHSNYFIPCINSGYSRYILYMINNKDNIFDIK